MACYWYPVCPVKIRTDRGEIDKKWTEEYCLSESNWKNCVRYQMEERGEYHSDKMLPDGSIVL